MLRRRTLDELFEIVNINLVSTEPAQQTALNGTSIHVSYEGFEGTFIFSGEVVSIKIPKDKNVTVTYGSATDFITPSADTFLTAARNVRNLNPTYTYVEPIEIVNVNIVSSDSSKQSLLNGTTFTVSYTGFSNTYTWNGSIVSITIPANKSVTITYGSVTNFNTAGSNNFTTIAGNTRSITATYVYVAPPERVNIRLVSNNSSQQSQLNGARINVQYTGFNQNYTWNGNTITLDIPEGNYVTVTFNNVNNFTKPGNSTFTTVSGNVRNVNGNYTYVPPIPSRGAVIIANDGQYYTAETWNRPNSQALGIAILGEDSKFYISKMSTNSMPFGSFGGNQVQSIIRHSVDEARTDIDGYNNTATMYRYSDPRINSVIRYCHEQTDVFGNKGYLGAAGEWLIAGKYKDEIRTLSNKIGASLFNGYGRMYTSSVWAAGALARYYPYNMENNSIEEPESDYQKANYYVFFPL